MKKQKPLFKKHWKDEFCKWSKKFFRREERNLAKREIKNNEE